MGDDMKLIEASAKAVWEMVAAAFKGLCRALFDWALNQIRHLLAEAVGRLAAWVSGQASASGCRSAESRVNVQLGRTLATLGARLEAYAEELDVEDAVTRFGAELAALEPGLMGS
jgi:hypothetical protein